MSMYIQTFLSADECAQKINEKLKAEKLDVQFGFEAKALKDEDPRGFYVAIKVPMESSAYPAIGIMRQVVDMVTPILSEYTDSTSQMTFYRPHRDNMVVSIAGIRSKRLQPTS